MLDYIKQKAQKLPENNRSLFGLTINIVGILVLSSLYFFENGSVKSSNIYIIILMLGSSLLGFIDSKKYGVPIYTKIGIENIVRLRICLFYFFIFMSAVGVMYLLALIVKIPILN